MISVLADYIDKMEELQYSPDIERAHVDADDLLCDFLIVAGYGELVEAWEKVPKWYA